MQDGGASFAAPPPRMYPPQHMYRPYRRHYAGPMDGMQGHAPFNRRYPYNSNNPYHSQNAPVQYGPDGKPLPPGEYDGKRMRKAIQRRTVDYNSSIIQQLKMRTWKKCPGRRSTLQPDPQYYIEMTQPKCIKENPVNSICSRFVRTSTNKIRCPIFAGAWTPEGRRLVTGASSGEFTLWNGLTFNFETILQAHDTSIRTMEWSHNDMWLLSADHSGCVKYWQSNMNNVKMIRAHTDPVRGLSFSPTDNKFVTCSDDGLVKVWDFYRCYEERILRGHGADVKCVDWHPTKGLVVSGSKDSQQPIKLWDPKSGQSICTLHAHKSTVMDLQWNRNGNWLLTASRDHLIKVFDIRTMGELQVFRGHKKEATVIDWHPIHESMFASGGSEGSMFFWQIGCDKEIGSMSNAHDGMIWMLQWHPLGHIVCTGSNDHTCKFWTRNRPGDKMKDKYNLNTLPPGSEEEYEYEVPSKEEVEANLSLSDHAATTPAKADRTSESIEIPGLTIPAVESDVEPADVDATTTSNAVDHAQVIIPMLDTAAGMPVVHHSGFRLPGRQQNSDMPHENPQIASVLPMLNDVFAVPELQQQLARFDSSSNHYEGSVSSSPMPVFPDPLSMEKSLPAHVATNQPHATMRTAAALSKFDSKFDGKGLLPTPLASRRTSNEAATTTQDMGLPPVMNLEQGIGNNSIPLPGTHAVAFNGSGTHQPQQEVPTATPLLGQPPYIDTARPSDTGTGDANPQMLSWRNRQHEAPPPTNVQPFLGQTPPTTLQQPFLGHSEGPQQNWHNPQQDGFRPPIDTTSLHVDNSRQEHFIGDNRFGRGRGCGSRRGRSFPFQ